MTLKERAKQLKIDLSAVFIAMGRKDTPVLAKVIVGVTVGYLDDLIILPYQRF